MSSGNISYIYDATGVKLEKVVAEGTAITRTKYAGNYVYENDALQFFSQPEGYVEPDGSAYNYVYQYKDHLGNIRLSYKDISLTSTPSLQIVEENNYYPFGLKHKGYNNVVSSNANSVASKFKYNGIELEESLGLNLYEMDFRQYDPAIARFTSIDPVIHHSMSTYTAFDNNPIFYADPSGADSQSLQDLINQMTPGVTYTSNGDGTFSGNGHTVGDANSSSNSDSSETGNETTGYGINSNSSNSVVGNSSVSVNQDPCPNCPDKEKRKLAIMMAKQNGGNAQDYYNALTNPDFINDRISDNVNGLLNISMLFGVGEAYVFLRGLFSKSAIAKLIIRPDIILKGGRSGSLVKTLTGPANSVLKGGNGRIFITDKTGKVIWDITKDRAKSVIPGKGFGPKLTPTKEQLNLLNQIWGK